MDEALTTFIKEEYTKAMRRAANIANSLRLTVIFITSIAVLIAVLTSDMVAAAKYNEIDTSIYSENTVHAMPWFAGLLIIATGMVFDGLIKHTIGMQDSKGDEAAVHRINVLLRIPVFGALLWLLINGSLMYIPAIIAVLAVTVADYQISESISVYSLIVLKLSDKATDEVFLQTVTEGVKRTGEFADDDLKELYKRHPEEYERIKETAEQIASGRDNNVRNN